MVTMHITYPDGETASAKYRGNIVEILALYADFDSEPDTLVDLPTSDLGGEA